MKQLYYILQTARPKQWIKNCFIFIALFFSMSFLNPVMVLKTVESFVLFCFLASGIYIFNDIIDVENDKIHPKKKNRPIAAGKLKIKNAYLAFVLMSLLAIFGSYFVNWQVCLLFSIYFILFLTYSLKLKHFVIIDILVIAFGFVLRVLIGAFAISVPVSHWLVICTIFISLFLGFSKRRQKLITLQNQSAKHRKALSEYSPQFLDQMVAISTASIIISYTLYTTAAETVARIHTDGLIYTVPFVLYGVFRYLYLVYQKKEGGSPSELIISDKPFLANIILWVIAVFVILYLNKL